MAEENQLFSFEGARLRFGESFPSEETEQESDANGGASNSESDLESEGMVPGEGDGQTAKELHHIRCGRGQKRRPSVSDSDSDDPFSILVSQTRKFSKQPKRYKSTLTPSSKSSTVPSTPKTATPKNSMANTPKIVPRSAPPKRSLPSTTVTHKSATPSRSTSTKDACSSVSAKETTGDKDKGKEFESLSIAVLQEISSKLNSVAERVVRMETKLEAMEKRSTPSSSSDARTPKHKRVIPHTLRVSVFKKHGYVC